MLKVIEKLKNISQNDNDISIAIGFFKNEVAAYLELLKHIDDKIKRNDPNSDEIQNTLNNRTYWIVKKGYELESLIEQKTLVEEIKKSFRNLIINWMGKSLIIKRALTKPRGYPGDYQMLEYIYGNKPISEGIGYYFDRGFLSNDLCVAVRNRKDMMANLIKDFLKEKNKPEVNILNLACGSSREINQISEALSDYDVNIDMVFVDHDELALDYSNNKLKGKKGLKATFIKEDIISIIRNAKRDLFKGQDLIYSIGLIDYLPERLLKKLVKLCYEGLNSGGYLILSHKDHDKYIPMREDWLTDWKFIPRNEEKLLNIVANSGIQRSNIKIIREDSRIIFFLIIEKK